MNLRRIIKEELDDLSWIDEVPSGISPKELEPGDRFRIISIKGKALSSYMEDEDLSPVDPHSIIFKMDMTHNFQNDEGDSFNRYRKRCNEIWLRSESDPQQVRGWVKLKGLIVVKL